MGNQRPSLTLYYDGWCPLCTAVKQRLERWDWLGQLSYADLRSPGAAEALGVPLQQLAERMHAHRHRDGRLLEGIAAVTATAARIPLLWPLWPWLLLATATGLGQPLYDRIARSRRIVPVGQCDETGCRIHPPG